MAQSTLTPEELDGILKVHQSYIYENNKRDDLILAAAAICYVLYRTTNSSEGAVSFFTLEAAWQSLVLADSVVSSMT